MSEFQLPTTSITKGIKNFTIFGERNSGTTYLQHILEYQLKIPFTDKYGHKHRYIKNLYPRGEANSTTDNLCIVDVDNIEADNTLFIVCVRNPIDWVVKTYQRPHMFRNIDKSSLYNFTIHKYLCYHKHQPYYYKINPEVTHPHLYFIEQADDLIKLRNMKYKHFYKLTKKVKHSYIVRLEHFKDDIEGLIKKYNLIKHNSDYPRYRIPNTYNIDDRTKQFVINHIKNQIDNKYYKEFTKKFNKDDNTEDESGSELEDELSSNIDSE